jgi:hypothetical protein
MMNMFMMAIVRRSFSAEDSPAKIWRGVD